MEKTNLALPGNPRYQPKNLHAMFGYDNLYRWIAKVEIANLQVLGEIGVIPQQEIALLTPEKIQILEEIRTTRVDQRERQVTKHDIRAWVQLAQESMGNDLSKWMHVTLTSYDPISTGRILQYQTTYNKVLSPSIKEVISLIAAMVEKFADTLQIGRTHGQHALPITAGFWLATILERIVYNWEKMNQFSNELTGKISGAVGAYNAQVGLQIADKCGEATFEERILEKIGLKPAKISTQILSPEPLAYFLHSCVMLSATFAQLGRDCRHLMRSEIAEVSESFGATQVGSSTMAHKRNPINFENLEGQYTKTMCEYMKVLMTLISEHQRDLTGSSVARDFPTIIVNLQTQLNTLLRENNENIPFLSRISIDEKACIKNFEMSSDYVLAEPVYIALQMAGYTGDAHELVNRKLLAASKKNNISLIDALIDEAENQKGELEEALKAIPSEVITLLSSPQNYTGSASEKAMEIANYSQKLIQ